MKLIFALSLLLISNSVYARPGGVDVGGSGTGVVKGNAIYLEDLVEQGIETQQVASPSSVTFQAPFFDATWLDDQTKAVLASKIHLLAMTDRILGTAIIKAFQAYSWSLVDGPLVTLQPTDTVLQAQFIQLAIRKPLAIYISKPAWAKMPTYHRAALILHEMIETLLAPTEPAIRGRQVVGAVFAQTIDLPLPDGVADEINRALPSVKSLQTSKDLVDGGTEIWPNPPQTALGNILFFRSFDLYGAEANAITGTPPLIQEDWHATIFPFVDLREKGMLENSTYLEQSNYSSLTIGLCGSEHRGLESATFSAYDLSLTLGDSDPVSGPHLVAHLSPTELMTEHFANGCSAVVRAELTWMNQLFSVSY